MNDHDTRTQPPEPSPVRDTLTPDPAALMRALNLVGPAEASGHGTPAGWRAPPPGEQVRAAPADRVVLPGYEILGELGRGGMGVVYKARQQGLNRVVALKMVLGSGPIDPRAALRFVVEAESVAAVRHPNIVQVYDYGEAGGRPFMALEFCPNGTLADRLEAGTALDPRAAAGWICRVAAGVAGAHQQGIVHRDLKPGNILFDEKGEPKVADFGLAKRSLSDLTATQAVMGTPAYMSPEQASGRTKFVGPQADVWALGVILYECLTGGRPFEADSREEVLARVLNGSPEPIRSRVTGTPRDLELICQKCMTKEPLERYDTAAELAADLERFLRGEPVDARPEGAFGQLWRWGKRNRTVALLTVALVLLLFVGLLATSRLAYLASRAAEAERSRTQERDAAIQKQQELAQTFLNLLAKDQKLTTLELRKLRADFLVQHPEFRLAEFKEVFAPPAPPDFGIAHGASSAAGSNAPNLFGD